jgi:ribosomal protein S18 acetylase RimI-like enzyme
MQPLTLIPLSLEHHVTLLQAVYDAVPAYWQMLQLAGAPAGQAEHDLRIATTVAGRTLLGIVQRVEQENPQAGVEMIGMLDIWLHYPAEDTVSLGMVMVAEALQRQGIGRTAWLLLEPWLRQTAGMKTARLMVEQFNTTGLRFFSSLGFVMTGEANRTRIGDRFVRQLLMEKNLGGE